MNELKNDKRNPSETVMAIALMIILEVAAAILGASLTGLIALPVGYRLRNSGGIGGEWIVMYAGALAGIMVSHGVIFGRKKNRGRRKHKTRKVCHGNVQAGSAERWKQT